ncbi:HutP family protein [Halonatronum saccharophilum]|uniref:HutP family protein n=1 Tax=Halonatronum saccharophilum TaxID=150060 RepID=UPI00047F177D|nr:HutP family protein [Halonatronum saccharophilum]
MLVKDLMTKDVITINPSTTVEEAERLMSLNNIGKLVVVEDDNKVVGMITDGDLVQQRKLEMLINDIMTKEVIVTYKNKSIQEASQLLSDNQIGGVPVLDSKNKLVGILTAADIVAGYVKEERTAKISPESSAIYLAMTRSRDYENYWLDKIKGYGYRVAITQTGANAENLPIKLRESTTVAAIARGVIKENLREKMAVSNAVKDAYLQLNLVNPGLGGGFKVSIVRGEGRLAVAVFGKFGHALVDGPEQLAIGMSVV